MARLETDASCSGQDGFSSWPDGQGEKVISKSSKRDPVAKARKKVARAQNRYLKAVAKGERQIRNVRALVDEQIARAKAQFEMRASELAEAEESPSLSSGETTVSNYEQAAEMLEAAALEAAPAESEIVIPNGALTEPSSASRPKRRTRTAKTSTGKKPTRQSGK